jgi:hypothetical protein
MRAPHQAALPDSLIGAMPTPLLSSPVIEVGENIAPILRGVTGRSLRPLKRERELPD